jgi:dTDP-4-dehydrorhamnose reductase|tara:strand:- start:866 stop:1696 length:831 start_codon:yes stop_codon:yes gene_type:complete
MIKLSIIGNGYTAGFISKEALKKGIKVSIITRNIIKPEKNIHYFNFNDEINLQKKIQNEYLISTVPPNQDGTDPVIKKYKEEINSNNKKIIYLSATSVYGGGIVYEDTKPNPQNIRGKTRLKAETEWLITNNQTSIFRISGIYGPGRHPMIKYLNGNDEVIVKSGHVSNRINVEDLSAIVIKYLTENYNYKYLNISDENKIQSYDAIKYVAEKLNLNLPKAISYQSNKLSKAMKSFYEVDRVIKSKFISNEFNYKFKNSDYKEALLKLTKKLIKVT